MKCHNAFCDGTLVPAYMNTVDSSKMVMFCGKCFYMEDVDYAAFSAEPKVPADAENVRPSTTGKVE